MSAGKGPNQSDRWILLAEDDKLFTKLFERFWVLQFPEVELVKVSAVIQGKSVLTEKGSPVIAVLDLNLKDGASTALVEYLTCPYVIWSSAAVGDLRAKPVGRAQLETSIRELGRLGGLDVPSQ